MSSEIDFKNDPRFTPGPDSPAWLAALGEADEFVEKYLKKQGDKMNTESFRTAKGEPLENKEVRVRQVLLADLSYDGNLKFDEEEISRLKDSVRAQGLHHPITVQRVGKDFPEKYHVVAGKKRLRVFRDLGFTSIPCKILSENENAKEISLHENLRRNNLPWYDLVVLEKELHDLRVAEHGGNKGSKFSPTKAWSQVDTARELGIAMGTLSEDLALANALKNNPGLSKIKDRITALKLVKNTAKREEAEVEALLPTSEDFWDQCFLGEAEAVLAQLPSNTFDLCLTDPPWSSYARDEELTARPEDLLPVLRQVYRVLKPQSILIMILSTPDFIFYSDRLPELGFEIQSWPLIWHKPNQLGYGIMKPWQTKRDYEPILLAAKGRPTRTRGTDCSSVFTFDNIHNTSRIHPHEKPVELLSSLIQEFSFSGGKILEPFAGSGVTLEACKRNDRRFVGIEKEKSFFDRIQERLGK